MNTHPIECGRQSGRRSQLRRLMRAANSNVRHRTGLKPGPFDPSALKDERSATSTLITGLLVIYPLLASAGVVLAGFLLLPHGPA